MANRSTLLIGSLPFEDEAQCMRRALTTLGPQLFSLPDGEIGEKSAQFPRGNRIAWVMYAIEVLTADRDSWNVVREPVRGSDGMATDYDHIQQLKPRRSPGELPQHVQLGYDRFFERSYPIFKQLRHEYGQPQLKFQLGIPTGFAMGFAFASKLDWLRYTGAFNTVLAREVNHALAQAGDDLIIQLELPPEVYAAYLLPKALHRLALRSVLDLVGKITPGAQIGLHLCLGDFHNEAVVHPKTLDKLVAFSNRLVDAWPSTHRLVYMHYPFAEGAVPPRLEPNYYRPLREIRLPTGTRFIAGFVHEKLSLDENTRVLAAIEQARGQTVDVAASCGLGRRTPEQAEQVLELSRQLAMLA
jgi:hypothetical protein